MNSVVKIACGILAGVALAGPAANAAQVNGAREFRQNIQPVLENYCFDCHADGANKGNVAFDDFETDAAALENKELWLHALKNLRAGLMPPPKKPQPTPEEKERIVQWIKRSVFETDPQNPDPGRVTLRRLNRAEYQNTIRDLIGVNFDTQSAFPPDDTGHGFDNIADVLTLPPMLLEKYVVAANQIVGQAVPTAARVVREEVVDGVEFSGAENVLPKTRRRHPEFPEPLALSYYQPAAVTNLFKADHAGAYQLVLALMINENYVDNVFDYNKCRLIFRVDGKELLREEFSWEGGKPYTYNFDADWAAGNHELAFELTPLTPNQPQTRSLSLQITSVKVRGPMAKEHWVQAKGYQQFFPRAVPSDAKGRRVYARELLGGFARRAFRRPPDEKTLDRLVNLAESVYSQPGKTFEAGVAQGMVAVLASPRFLFRDERVENSPGGAAYPFVDEFSLASRLSYFLWSSMPDEALLQLAENAELRKNLAKQVERMLKDKRSESFVRDFVGQWLRARDIETIPIEARFVLAREEKSGAELDRNRKRFRELRDRGDAQLTPAERDELQKLRATASRANNPPPRTELTGELRRAMRRETEKSFEYILREDRSLLELLEADYAFLNARLAAHYGIPDVVGNELRLVKLPADSPRGGILTQGTILGVTSNPTRTSPVKRGLFILDNILGTPPPPPPPDIPPLEDAAKGLTNRTPTLRETLAAHRETALCNSCHNRMDPLGLALENFNAMGMWRDSEFGEPIDATGSLVTGETFNDVRDLKRSLVTNHSEDFYRTVTEKMLIYALGRGLEYYDVETCDQIVSRIKAAQGRPSALLAGVVESAPFQKMRTTDQSKPKPSAKPEQRRADAGIKP
jgi:mono/diheme cytochrome c family protein